MIVISTVGLMESFRDSDKFEEIGCNRHYETMAFHADINDKRYHDADVSRQVNFDSNWCIEEVDADDKANNMHEVIVTEITGNLKHGAKYV